MKRLVNLTWSGGAPYPEMPVLLLLLLLLQAPTPPKVQPPPPPRPAPYHGSKVATSSYISSSARAVQPF